MVSIRTLCLRPFSAVAGICYSTVTLTFDLLTPTCEAFISIPLCINAVILEKIYQKQKTGMRLQWPR